jgi:hypothetical protein
MKVNVPMNSAASFCERLGMHPSVGDPNRVDEKSARTRGFY